jgi:hypothetical protein
VVLSAPEVPEEGAPEQLAGQRGQVEPQTQVVVVGGVVVLLVELAAQAAQVS